MHNLREQKIIIMPKPVPEKWLRLVVYKRRKLALSFKQQFRLYESQGGGSLTLAKVQSSRPALFSDRDSTERLTWKFVIWKSLPLFTQIPWSDPAPRNRSDRRANSALLILYLPAPYVFPDKRLFRPWLMTFPIKYPLRIARAKMPFFAERVPDDFRSWRAQFLAPTNEKSMFGQVRCLSRIFRGRKAARGGISFPGSQSKSKTKFRPTACYCSRGTRDNYLLFYCHSALSAVTMSPAVFTRFAIFGFGTNGRLLEMRWEAAFLDFEEICVFIHLFNGILWCLYGPLQKKEQL